jgi:hypothetical protein
MKTTLLSFLFIAALSLPACDPQSNLSPNTSQTVSSGTWRVTLFTDSGNDETSDFTGFTFTFSDNGSVNAVKNGLTKNGAWSVNTSSGKFNIDLGLKVDSNKPLGELTDDWKIISTTETEIKLTDDNAGSNEFLTFTKN